MTDTPTFAESGLTDGMTPDAVEAAQRRIDDFRIRAGGGITFANGYEFEQFCQDLITTAEAARARRPRGKVPEVWTAAEQLAAVKYAEEKGFVTALEAQRMVRKLLHLRGKRTLAVRKPVARRRPATRRKP